MSPRHPVLVTRRLPPRAMADLASRVDLTCNPHDRPLSKTELMGLIADKTGVLATLADEIDAEVLAAAPALKVVANYAVGYNNIDLAAARARSVVVTNTPGVLTDATADLTWALILGVGRRLGEGERLVRGGGWTGWAPTQLLGAELTGAALGVVGMGRIGQAVARRAAGFGMRVLYASRRPTAEARPQWRMVPLGTLLAEADVVSLHVPLTPDTRRLIGVRELATMKRTAYLINTARGPVVDEAALAEALRAGVIAGAGLDVYEREPAVHPALLACEHALLLPHLGSATTATRERMGRMAIDNLLAVLDGRDAPNAVTDAPRNAEGRGTPRPSL